jgi:uncharacterized protein
LALFSFDFTTNQLWQAMILLKTLHRYPIKGLSPESLSEAVLTAGGYFPGDRLYAIENGPSGFDPDKPEHQPKFKFLMLMRNETLARLQTRYDDATRMVSIVHQGRDVLRADFSTAQGRSALEAFFANYARDDLKGPPRLLEAPDSFRFTDSRSGFVSILNLASVAAIETMVGAAVDPLRFRMNLALDGLAAWQEFDLVGARLEIGDAVLEVMKPTERCAATNVDPVMGMRDLAIPRTLMQQLNHANCGVYAKVVQGGRIRPGQRVQIVPHAQGNLPFG